MNAKQAIEHNKQIGEKIKELQKQMVYRFRVRVVERQGSKRITVEDMNTDFIPETQVKQIYDDYKGMYPDAKKFFILIDPIDSNRNVASAISEKAYRYCNQRIKEYLEYPSKDYFKVSTIPEINLSNQNDSILSKTFIIELKNKDTNVHYTINRDKLYSLGDRIKANGEREFSHEKRFGTIVFEVYFEDKINEYNLVIYCDKLKISPSYLRKGPRVNEKFHAEKFKKKNPNFILKDGYLWTDTKREFDEFFDFLKNFIDDKIPENLEVVNIANSFYCKTISGKRAIYVLKNMVLPFF